MPFGPAELIITLINVCCCLECVGMIHVFRQFPADLWRNDGCSSLEKFCCWLYLVCIYFWASSFPELACSIGTCKKHAVQMCTHQTVSMELFDVLRFHLYLGSNCQIHLARYIFAKTMAEFKHSCLCLCYCIRLCQDV